MFQWILTYNQQMQVIYNNTFAVKTYIILVHALTLLSLGRSKWTRYLVRKLSEAFLAVKMDQVYI